ncbi:universal stress protein [Nocardiopsis gilva]|uniref:universal stress protein n=1 Tax=Nocardiopsis gilva TaxID=280236 RepID=UPI001E477BFF|nr:universal stress protein [Nocardiopsis gilva]
MAGHTTTPIVAAVDGGKSAARAADWAADEAQRQRRPLHIVHANEWPMFHSSLGPAAEEMAHAARDIVSKARDRAHERAPDIAIEAHTVDGYSSAVLLEHSRHAHMLVSGTRRLSGLEALWMGSTGLELATQASCPVVLVPDIDPGQPRGIVSVGVDGSRAADAAAQQAFIAAAERGALLRVVCSYGPGSHGRFGPLEHAELTWHDASPEEASARAEAERLLSESIAGEREHHPDVRVEEVVLRALPERALISESHRADMVVVGARGRGGFAGLLLGSVSQKLVHHADCPVMIVRAKEHQGG